LFVSATFLSDFWNDQLVAHDRQWLFLVLVGLIGSFGFIRTLFATLAVLAGGGEPTERETPRLSGAFSQ
jgi:hypothetical protein